MEANVRLTPIQSPHTTFQETTIMSAKAKEIGNFTLKSVEPQGSGRIKVRIVREADKLALTLHPEGHGTLDGDFAPVVIELKDKMVRLIVWADINQEDPTHIIQLDGALLSRFRELESDSGR
jgi:hypothetical protein